MPTASGTLEIVSLHREPLVPALASGEPQITIPNVLRPLVKMPVHVRALALPARTYYRMDGWLATPVGVLRWPLEDIVRQIPIDDADLGVFAWYADSETVYLPVEMAVEGGANAGSSTVLRVRIPFDSDAVLWRRSPPNTPGAATWTRVPGRFRQWSIVDLTVPPAAGAPGLLIVEVTAKLLNTDEWDVLTLHVLQP